VRPRVLHLAWSSGLAALIALGAGAARAENCKILRYTFQPDSFPPVFVDPQADPRIVQRLDLGPQIAIWIESADGSRFIDTLMVTNMVATRGLGNRPGLPNFISSPKFPYGKRQMALPIWAHRRGKLYDTVVMQDDREDWWGWHEGHSGEDPYYCRPVMPSEINVDAITCPTKFNSAKGKLISTAKSYYPPRNDLTTFISKDCDVVGATLPGCNVSARSYAELNDLDAVAAATPAYGKAFSATWHIPPGLPPGDYVVMVEVNKEYDTNAAHDIPTCCENATDSTVRCTPEVFPPCALGDPRLPAYGLPHNFGQPSVVYRVPIHIEGLTAMKAAVSQIVGYSDWTGETGVLNPRDASISTTVPGSGEARLLEIAGPGGTGRVHVNLEQCTPLVCAPAPPPPTSVTGLEPLPSALTASSAEIRFINASADGELVQAYDVRYRPGDSMTADEFAQATPAPAVEPGPPGIATTVVVQDLKPATRYVLGIRSIDGCMQQSEIAVITFQTPVQKFKQLSGCFIATAAYGSAMEAQVAALRQARDRLRPTSTLLAAATDLYYRSGPAAADVLRRSDTARAVVRRVLGPVAAVAEAALALVDRSGPPNPNPNHNH
jgi:hypothetical protein